VSVRDAVRDQLVRVRGVVRSNGATVKLPFSGASGVFHWTQLTDTSNPGETSLFTRSARCDFLIDDGTGLARVPREAAIALVGGEPEGRGVDRNDPEVERFLGGDVKRLFSKDGWLIWRQRALVEGDEVVIWGRVVHEPDPDPRRQESLREAPQRVVLAPPESNVPVVVERAR
jgi:hypothetical protein